MNNRALSIFSEFMKRIEKPCTCCKKLPRLCEIILNGIGDSMDGTGSPMLYFTHKTCGSTMVSRGPLKS